MDQLRHHKLLSTLQEKIAKALMKALLQQIINHCRDPFQAAGFLFCGELFASTTASKHVAMRVFSLRSDNAVA